VGNALAVHFQGVTKLMDSGFHRSDDLLRDHQKIGINFFSYKRKGIKSRENWEGFCSLITLQKPAKSQDPVNGVFLMNSA
jgi:hypothetical protein